MTPTGKRNGDITVVKKYANRRLYDTGRSSYVTLDDLCEMVKRDMDFIVVDAKSGEDLTRSVLTQIIVEQESREGNNLLPTNFLRQLIGFYGDKIQGLVPNYLEQSFGAFTANQDSFREQMSKSMGPMGAMFSMDAFEDMGRKNMAMFENAVRAMTPFPFRGQEETKPTAATGATSAPKRPASRQEKISQVRQGIAELQRELDKLQRM